MSEHACPRCGARTSGAWSDGGLRWAVCEDCMAKVRAQSAEEDRRAQQMRQAVKDSCRGMEDQ